MFEGNLAEQALEAMSPLDRCAGDAQIVINDEDAFTWPAQAHRQVYQAVLQLRRFAVSVHLVNRRLADINDREPFQVPRLDFLVIRQNREVGRGIHDDLLLVVIRPRFGARRFY